LLAPFFSLNLKKRAKKSYEKREAKVRLGSNCNFIFDLVGFFLYGMAKHTMAALAANHSR